MYSTDPVHLKKAQEYIQARTDSDKICVEVLPLTSYVASAEEHQDHLDKYPHDYCHISKELMTKYIC